MLEGEEKQLDATFKIIQNDDRHKGVTVLVSGELEQRNFGDWSMAYRTVNRNELSGLQGYFNPDSKEQLERRLSGTHASIKAIKSFLQVNPA